MQYSARSSIETSSTSPINHIKFQPKTNYAVIAQDATLKLFNVRKKSSILSYNSHIDFQNSMINSFDFITSSAISSSNGSPTDMKIVSVSKGVQIHDIAVATPIRYYHTYNSSKFKINDVVSLSAEVIATCDENCLVKLYDLRQNSNFKPIQEFQESKDSLNCIDYDHTSKSLFVGSNDGGLYCYDLRKGLLVRDEFDTPITSIEVQQFQNRILLSLLNDPIVLFDLDDARNVTKLVKNQHDKEFRIDSRFYSTGFISGSETGELYLYDESSNTTESMSLFDTKFDQHAKIVSSLSVDGDKILIGNGTGKLELIEGLVG